MVTLAAATLILLSPKQEASQAAIAGILGQWGKQALEDMRRDFYQSSTRNYGEKWTGKVGKDPTFAWGAGIVLSALNSAAKLGGAYRMWQREYANTLESYWHTAGPVPGFSVWPKQKDPDRYYDDNAWIAIALLETFEIQNDWKYLKRATATVDYVLSGADSRLGGGIYWREKEKKSKNTCVNAPAIVACLMLSEKSQTSKYKDAALRLYTWTRENLRDPSDGLYYDNIDLQGNLEKTKWSYNSALMLRAATLLYKETKDRKYYDDARQIELQSIMRWYASPISGILKDEGRFGHLLMEAWIERRKVIPDMWMPKLGSITLYNLPLSFLWNKGRDKNGHFAKRWDAELSAPLTSTEIIDQASAVRAFLLASEALSK